MSIPVPSPVRNLPSVPGSVSSGGLIAASLRFNLSSSISSLSSSFSVGSVSVRSLSLTAFNLFRNALVYALTGMLSGSVAAFFAGGGGGGAEGATGSAFCSFFFNALRGSFSPLPDLLADSVVESTLCCLGVLVLLVGFVGACSLEIGTPAPLTPPVGLDRTLPSLAPFKMPPRGPRNVCCVASALNAWIAIDSIACLVNGDKFGFCLTATNILRTASWSAGLATSLLASCR